jgi:hypothetical protein
MLRSPIGTPLTVVFRCAPFECDSVVDRGDARGEWRLRSPAANDQRGECGRAHDAQKSHAPYFDPHWTCCKRALTPLLTYG